MLGEVHYQGVPLPRDAEHMNPDKVMEHPACCGVLHRFALLVGKCRVVVLEDLTDAVLYLTFRIEALIWVNIHL